MIETGPGVGVTDGAQLGARACDASTVTNGAPTWGSSQVVTTPMTIDDDVVRSVMTKQPTSIPQTPQPRHRSRISLWEELAGQPVTLSTPWLWVALVVCISMLVVSTSNGRRRTLRNHHILRHSHRPSRLSSLQRSPNLQHVALGYMQPEAESRDVFVDVPGPDSASTPATAETQSGASDAAVANKPKLGRSKESSSSSS